MNGSGKHSSLLRYGNNYCRKMFIVQAPGFKPLNWSAVATDANAAALHYENFVEDFIFRW